MDSSLTPVVPDHTFSVHPMIRGGHAPAPPYGLPSLKDHQTDSDTPPTDRWGGGRSKRKAAAGNATEPQDEFIEAHEEAGNGARLLIVTADTGHGRLLRRQLAQGGYQIRFAQSGAEALTEVGKGGIELVLLAGQVVDIAPEALCRRLKAKTNNGSRVAVVQALAHFSSGQVVSMLDAGADDCITGPHLDTPVLLARIGSVLRRQQFAVQDEDSDKETIRAGRITIYPAEHVVIADGQRVDLTVIQFRLLLRLASRPGWVFSRDQLAEVLPAGHDGYDASTVKSHISNLRRRLGDAGKSIGTVRGLGYRLVD